MRGRRDTGIKGQLDRTKNRRGDTKMEADRMTEKKTYEKTDTDIMRYGDDKVERQMRRQKDRETEKQDAEIIEYRGTKEQVHRNGDACAIGFQLFGYLPLGAPREHASALLPWPRRRFRP